MNLIDPFKIEKAPTFGRENPEIYRETYGINLSSSSKFDSVKFLEPLEILDKTVKFINDRVPNYDYNTSNIDTALKNGVGNCIARTILFQTLVAPFEHIDSAVVIGHHEDIGCHWFNTFSTKEDCFDFVVDNKIIKNDKKEKFYKSELKLSTINSIEESCIGGVSNLLEMMKCRRNPEDMTLNEQWIFMFDTGKDKLDNTEKEEFENVDTDYCDYYMKKVTAVILNDYLAVAAVDAVCGKFTNTADKNFHKFLLDASKGNHY